MREDNDLEYWNTHRRGQKCRAGKGNQSSLDSFFGFAPSKRIKTRECPCPGIGFLNDTRILSYLLRTVVLTGGAPPRAVLMQQIKRAYALTHHRKSLKKDLVMKEVFAAERSQAVWTNSHSTGTVFSMKCEKIGIVSPHGTMQSCLPCQNVLRYRAFRNALRRKGAKPNGFKFTPKSYRNKLVGRAYLRHHDVKEFAEMVRLYLSFEFCNYNSTHRTKASRDGSCLHNERRMADTKPTLLS